VVLAAQHAGGGAEAHEALSDLCRDYWYPLYAFVRRCGHPPHDAQDLTQAFFVSLLEGGATAADPRRGRFRSYLLGALKHFLTNEFHRANALKRGGGQPMLEWDALGAEMRYELEPREQCDAEVLYDRRWAMDVLERAMRRLRGEFEARKSEVTFDALKGTLSGVEQAREELAQKLHLSEGALKVAVHRLRQRYREVLRAEIGETLDRPGDVEDEMRHLISILRAT
jgi:RNA polymerase sigma-70 factor (ECF subfamily)